MRVPEALSYKNIVARRTELEDERSEWETEWRQLSDFLIPGRGVYQTYNKPRKRKLTSTRVVNTIAEDSLYVLTSGMHAGLSSPTMPWFTMEWADKQLDKIEPLKAWLQECTEVLHTELQRSNFYSIISSFYVEYGGFGTACTYMGEDTPADGPAFRFELLTAGEYSFATGVEGLPVVFCRPVFMSPRKMVEKYPDTVSKKMKEDVEGNKPGIDVVDLNVLEFLEKRPFMDKKFTRIVYEVTGASNKFTSSEKEPLAMDGFYEFPYPLARWGTIGSDTYGIGPGSRALPDIKRLQEMEKAFLMATHKTINPPLNAPSRMRGKLNTLPGGYNYYANPNEMVKELYQVRFDYQGVGGAVERVEQRIRRNFFNDVFLTAVRDPNASPLRTGQVQAPEQEKMFRLGPVIERLQFEYFTQIIERGFNICLRKNRLPVLPPELAELAGDYNISLVSPLATAQRGVALQGINSFMGFLGQAAQFDQTILDNLDVDAAAREVAHINGVRVGILRPLDQVALKRKQRAEQIAAEKRKQETLALARAQTGMDAEAATAQKTQSEAGLNMIEGQQMLLDMGAPV